MIFGAIASTCKTGYYGVEDFVKFPSLFYLLIVIAPLRSDTHRLRRDIFMHNNFFEDIHVRNFFEIVHATYCTVTKHLQNTTLMHKQRIILANPNLIITQIPEI